MNKATYISAVLFCTLLYCSAFSQSKQNHVSYFPEIDSVPSVPKDSVITSYDNYINAATLAHDSANYKREFFEFSCAIAGICFYDGFRYTENGMHIDRSTIREMADWHQLISPHL